jgi:hypothetical protein
MVDRTSIPALRRYIEGCEAAEKSLLVKLHDFARRGEQFFVWGTGTLTLHLLEMAPLTNAPIAAFVDSNPRYQGKSIRGVPVIAPSQMPAGETPILVVTRDHSAAIEAQIRDLRLPNPVWTLYPNA